MNSINEILSNIAKFKQVCNDYNANLVLATKTIPQNTLELVAQSGQNLIFGENRVQEFRDKYFDCDNVTWHFIGRLQTNKVKYLIGKVDLIQSVDRADLLFEISRLSKKAGVVTNILIEVNVGLESQKGGVVKQDFDALIDLVDENVNVLGVMSVLPKGGDINALASELLELSRKLVLRFGEQANIISVGMSNDYMQCLQNGSNMIRLGTAIFGERY